MRRRGKAHAVVAARREAVQHERLAVEERRDARRRLRDGAAAAAVTVAAISTAMLAAVRRLALGCRPMFRPSVCNFQRAVRSARNLSRARDFSALCGSLAVPRACTWCAHCCSTRQYVCHVCRGPGKITSPPPILKQVLERSNSS